MIVGHIVAVRSTLPTRIHQYKAKVCELFSVWVFLGDSFILVLASGMSKSTIITAEKIVISSLISHFEVTFST